MVKQSVFASSYLAQPFAKGPPGQMEYPVANMGCFRGYSKGICRKSFPQVFVKTVDNFFPECGSNSYTDEDRTAE